MGYEVPGLDWSDGRLLPAFQSVQHLDVYDIRAASRDVQLAITTLTGLINRPRPRVYLITESEDIYWLQHLFQSVPQDAASVTGNAVLDALLTSYRENVDGVIIYDPGLVDSINIATTLAGQRDGLVVSPDLAQRLQDSYQLSLLVDLRTYQWRTRLQAYHWAQQNLLAASSGRMLAGLGPDNVSGLRAFLVATRTFVYWLDSRSYLPDFSDGLLSERALMQQIYASLPQGGLHLGWFIDESSGVYLTSQVAMTVLATDMCSNLEIWTAIQPEALSSQARTNNIPSADNKVYVSFTISDGDNVQYCQHRLLALWQDEARGSLPIGWTIAPALLHAAPTLAAYYLASATPNDELIAGPSGAGYIFPSHWPVERLPQFLQLTGQLMQALGLTTLELLDSALWESIGLPLLSDIRLSGMTCIDAASQQRIVQALVPYGLQGVLSGAGLLTPRWQKVEGLPFYHNLGLAGSVDQAVKLIKVAAATNIQRPLFLNVYILAWSMTPSQLQQVVQQLGSDYEFLLPYQLLAMLAPTIR